LKNLGITGIGANYTKPERIGKAASHPTVKKCNNLTVGRFTVKLLTLTSQYVKKYISPKILLDQNVKSLNTAKKYLGQMQELGIMVPEKIGKEIVYLNIDLFNLLSET